MYRAFMKIEHDPWLPKCLDGVEDQKIAIVGYSHYVDEPDRKDITNEVVRSVVEGKRRLRFFTAIQGYFGFTDAAEFWNRVIFFNFLPYSVGTRDDMYAVGDKEQIARGKERFLEIIQSERPAKVFVFTSKGWRDFPETTLEEQSGRACTALFRNQKEPNWGTYKIGDDHILVCGFRHPLFATGEDMRKQVKAFLEMRS